MKKDYDESFTSKEIELIDKLIKVSIKRNLLISEKKLRKILNTSKI